MSVYIKGMEMPTSCPACMFNVYGLCLINKNIEGKDELTHSCHLVPVPDHGRLIDADALKKQGYFFPCATGSEYAIPLRAVRDAPTIIPAEEANE